MKLILLSGGSGKRLWPLSNDSRSKQFIKVNRSIEEDDRIRLSMLQRVWQQIEGAGLEHSAVIAAARTQEELIVTQLGAVAPLVLEPERRDTFPAIALACAYMHSEMRMSGDEVIVVMPVDVDVDDDYYEELKTMAAIAAQSEEGIVLMGIAPANPSEKYGYIIPAPGQASDQNLLKVQHFIEKPPSSEAEMWIGLGALWNAGVFAFRLEYILRILRQGGWPLRYDELVRQYHLLPQNSFDYEVVEKEARIAVKPFTGRWNDLGTWNEWTEQMKEQLYGKGVVSSDSENTHVINELDIPVVVLGISNAVVVASPDGILISDKAESVRLKQMVQTVSTRPMYKETLYGWYSILHMGEPTQDQQSLTKRVHIYAGKQISYQVHYKRSEMWTIVRGKAEVTVDGLSYTASAGDVVRILPGAKHGIKAITTVDLIEIQVGESIEEEDIVRFEYAQQT
ncbi:sugar phosphate nucleotidyltransferase [Paenibacillus dendritiformis]|uniref:sugar phosphate nucleotidyltransferase n=1 Tax=Paenibacillus dendritiformis TaxID=130049 RepID=UPI00140CD242|nr:sugar phosphate nucleotidyltransferase [Paenibacillus dendritiformis]